MIWELSNLENFGWSRPKIKDGNILPRTKQFINVQVGVQTNNTGARLRNTNDKLLTADEINMMSPTEKPMPFQVFPSIVFPSQLKTKTFQRRSREGYWSPCWQKRPEFLRWLLFITLRLLVSSCIIMHYGIRDCPLYLRIVFPLLSRSSRL